MPKRFFTVLILPDATSTAHKVHVTRTALTILSAAAVIAILAFGFFIYQYVSLNVHVLELKRLRQEAGERTQFAAKVTELEGELTRLRELDRSLRVAAGLDKTPRAGDVQGGAEGVSRLALMDALEQRSGRLADAMGRDLEVLGQEIVSREQSLTELKRYLEDKRSVLNSTPTIAPVHGLVTAGYGYRRSPFTGQREVHEGLDIAAPYGSPVVAAADGIVTFVGPLAAYGHVVFVNHGHGFATFYAHNSRYRVNEGQTVRRGDVLAHVGNSGRTTGPHLHYEVHVNGSIVNPLKYIVDTSVLKFTGEDQGAAES
jgi:murein DD-endopeptidase MepM/ murein hydrolase activator NlpD